MSGWKVRARAPRPKDGQNWQLIYQRPDGSRYQRSARTPDEAEARRRARDAQAELNGERPSLARVVERYLAGSPDLRPRTRDAYRRAARRLGPLVDDLEQLRPALLLKARDELATRLCARTVNHTFGLAKTAWTWCAERELVPEPWPKLRALRVAPDNKRPATAEEVRALLVAFAEFQGGAWLPLVAFLAATGARQGEAFGLRERDLDRAAGMAHLRSEAVKTGRRRSLAIPRDVLELLPEREDPAALVFQVRGLPCGAPRDHPDREGPVASFFFAWRAVVEQLGWERRGLTPHTLRRSWIVAAHQGGHATLGQSMAQVGHSSPRMHQHYQRGAPVPGLERVAEDVAAALGIPSALKPLRLLEQAAG